MVENRITVFKEKDYERMRKRVIGLNEIESALKLIKNDERLQRFLREYSQRGISKGDGDEQIDFYRRRKLIKPKQSILGVKARPKRATVCMLSIVLDPEANNIMPLRFSREVFSKMEGYCSIDVGYHWDRYGVNESKSGGFYLKSLDMPDGVYSSDENSEGEYDGIRITQVGLLKNLRRVDVIGDLEGTLLRLKKK